MNNFQPTTALISCDEYVYSYQGNFYFRTFGKILCNRYLDVFSQIILAVRVKFVSTQEALQNFKLLIDDERITIHPVSFFQGPLEYLQEFVKIQTQVRKIPYCDVAIFRLPSTVGFAVLDEIKKRNIPYAVEVIFSPIDMVHNGRKIIERFLWRRIHKFQVNAIQGAVGVSYVTEFKLQNEYPAPKDAFLSHYSSIELLDSAFGSKRLFPNPRQYVISHVADPISGERKGHRVVMELIRFLRDANVDVIAKFAGTGDAVPYLKNLAKKLDIEDAVFFVGHLNPSELITFLDEAHIMVFPSEAEGLPRVLIEAMSRGLPCLSTPVSGIPELLPESVLYDKNDIQGFAQAFIRIFTSPEYYETLSAQSYLKAQEFKKSVLDKRRREFFLQLKRLIKS